MKTPAIVILSTIIAMISPIYILGFYYGRTGRNTGFGFYDMKKKSKTK